MDNLVHLFKLLGLLGEKFLNGLEKFDNLKTQTANLQKLFDRQYPKDGNVNLGVGSDDKSVYAISVPEPATWVMMLLGFAGLGFGAFRPTTKQTPEAIA